MQAMHILKEENQALQEENQALSRNQRSGATKRKPPKRPVIEANIDDSDWALFQDTWERYKKMTGLESKEDIILELRQACYEDFNKLLFEFVGSSTLNSAELDEIKLLQHIHSVAVKGVHREVHRMNFSKLTQSTGETITHYVARLNAKASLCNFNIEFACNEKVSFAEEMVAQQLVAGLRNKEHQSKVLGDARHSLNYRRRLRG